MPEAAVPEAAVAAGGAPAVLSREAIRLGLTAADRDEAVAQAGRLLVDLGAVDAGYPATMREREAMVSSYVGEGVAIPHGTDAGRALVRRTCLAVLQYPDGVDWDGQQVHLAVAIAAAADEHMAVMSRLAQVLLRPDAVAAMATTTDPEVVLDLLADDLT